MLLFRGVIFLSLIISPHTILADNIYELRKLTEDGWLEMTTDERMRALSTAVSHVPDQPFIGYFGRHYDLYKKWGYDYYEMEDRYESYAHSDFYTTFRTLPSYDYIEARRRRWSYNEFGDRIVKMVGKTAVIWNETHYKDGTYSVTNPKDFINA